MTELILSPGCSPSSIRDATPRGDDPSALLESRYREIWQARMSEMPDANVALSIEAVGFARYEGDWLGVVITPWFLNLVLISGGGQLWGDIPAGERRYLSLPCGTMQFVADDDPAIGPYQYCPLVASIGMVADMATARLVAADAMKTVFVGQAGAAEPGAEPETDGKPQVSRRGFFRRLAGKRN